MFGERSCHLVKSCQGHVVLVRGAIMSSCKVMSSCKESGKRCAGKITMLVPNHRQIGPWARVQSIEICSTYYVHQSAGDKGQTMWDM